MRTSLLLASLLLLCSVGGVHSDAPREYDDAVKMDGLEGEWDKVEVFYNGQNLGRSGHPTFVVRGQTFTWKGGGETTNGTYTLDTTTKPARTIQLPSSGPGKGTTWRMIYQVEGDRLTIAYLGQISEYPKGFNDPNAYVTIMRRVKR
jgi:uncharacterized protein (TIGR03067 family)